jgi:hypothetical protein
MALEFSLVERINMSFGSVRFLVVSFACCLSVVGWFGTKSFLFGAVLGVIFAGTIVNAIYVFRELKEGKKARAVFYAVSFNFLLVFALDPLLAAALRFPDWLLFSRFAIDWKIIVGSGAIFLLGMMAPILLKRYRR